MKTRTKKLATLLTAGVALSSGAYALGSQAGGGGALASSAGASGANATNAAVTRGGGPGARGLRRGGGPGLDALATKLGVTPTALQDALKAMRDEKTPAQRRAELTQALATALGKPVDQVTAAVNSVLPDRGPGRPGGADKARGDFAAALAKALAVDPAKVQAGLDKARRDFGNGPRDRDRNGRRGARLDTLVNDIASATGVDAAKVRAALQTLRPRAGDRRDRRGARDDRRAKLASALGVTPAALDAALQKVRTQERDAFATELAQKLSIDPQKVKDAFAALPGPGRRHG
jgi:Clp amino terminal domain, pathogenicity island component